ncbi:MAG TPA: L,D-transpeptidase family protein [Xanthobacteraceae bacterium]|nr:L,D-transpeptidase family protein [Xanthobacteraceae bacterium]
MRFVTMHSVTMVPASLLAAALSLPLASAASANIAIHVDKSTQRMTVAVDGQQRYVWPVSTGRSGYDTPSGSFKINRLDADHHSKEYDDAFMPDSMFFDLEGHAIHGFNDVPHLGMAVSHGCVRLSPANAAVLFGLVKQEGLANTAVEITGHIPRAPLVASRQAPPQQAQEAANAPMQIEPGYGQPQAYPAPQPYYRAQPQPYNDAQQQQAYGQRYYAQQPQPYYGQSYYSQGYGQPRTYYTPPGYPPQPPPVYRSW